MSLIDDLNIAGPPPAPPPQTEGAKPAETLLDRLNAVGPAAQQKPSAPDRIGYEAEQAARTAAAPGALVDKLNSPNAPTGPSVGSVYTNFFNGLNKDIAGILDKAGVLNPFVAATTIVAPHAWRMLPDEEKKSLREQFPAAGGIMNTLDRMSSDENMGKGMFTLGMEKSRMIHPEVTPQNLTERAAESAGKSAADMLAMAAGAEGVLLSRTWSASEALLKSSLEMLSGVGPTSNTLMGAGAGAAGQVAKEKTPDKIILPSGHVINPQPTAQMIGELAGGLPGAVGGSFVDTLFSTIGKHLTNNYTAAKKILDTAQDPERFRTNLANSPTPPPKGQVNPEEATVGSGPFVPATERVAGSEPTAGQAGGDSGVLGLEKKLSRSANSQGDFTDRMAEQNLARRQAIEAIETNDPSAATKVKSYVATRIDDLTDEHAMRVELAKKDAHEALDAAGGQQYANPAEYGEAIRTRLDAIHKEADARVDRLFKAIDPEKKVPLETDNLKANLEEAYSGFMKADKPPTGEEKRLLTVVQEFKPTESFGELVSLRRSLVDEMRAKRSSDPNTYGRLEKFLKVVDDELSSKAGEVAATPDGAARMKTELRREADEHFAATNDNAAARTGTGGGLPGEGTGSVPEGGVRPAPGEEGAAGGPIGSDAGGLRLSEDEILRKHDDLVAKRDELLGQFDNARKANDTPAMYRIGEQLSATVDEMEANANRVGDKRVLTDAEAPSAANDSVVEGPGAGRARSSEEIASDLATAKEQHKASGEETDLDRVVALTNEHRSARAAEVAAEQERARAASGEVRAGAEARAGEALGAEAEKRATLESGPVGDVLAPGREPGSFKMVSSDVADNILSTPEKLDAFFEATRGQGGPDDPGRIARDLAVASIRKAATKDGVVDQAKLRKWMDDHAHVVDSFRGLRSTLEDVRLTQDLVDEAAATQKSELAAAQDAAAKRVLGEGRTVDAVGAALEKPGEFESLVNKVSTDPEARAGLRRLTLDHILERITLPKEAGVSEVNQLDGASLEKLLGRYEESMTKGNLFSRDEIQSMKDVAADWKQAQRTANAVSGNDYIGRKINGLTLFLIRRGGEIAGAAIGGAAGHSAEGLGGALKGMGAGLAVGGAADYYLLRKMGRMEELVSDMLLHPDVAREWTNRVAVTERNRDSLLEGIFKRTDALIANSAVHRADNPR